MSNVLMKMPFVLPDRANAGMGLLLKMARVVRFLSCPLSSVSALGISVSGDVDGSLNAKCRSDGTCNDLNAFCNQQVCKCKEGFFEKNRQCGTAHYHVHTIT
jgi:hypothetical protein